MPEIRPVDEDQQKRAAALYAAGLVQDSMTVGLGTGTTAAVLVESLGKRWQEGLRFVGVPTSEKTAAQARSYGISITTLGAKPRLDMNIDGADEVDPDLNLIKGHGGALLREKLVASAAETFVVIVDQSKLVDHLGLNFPLPVEVVRFGWSSTRHRLEDLGLQCELRGGKDQPYVTDNDNYILDCHWRQSPHSLLDLAGHIKMLTGVVDHGLFLNMASLVVVGVGSDGVRILRRDGPPESAALPTY